MFYPISHTDTDYWLLTQSVAIIITQLKETIRRNLFLVVYCISGPIERSVSAIEIMFLGASVEFDPIGLSFSVIISST